MGTYHSTRGRTLSCSSKVAIRTGIAPDGGLFVSDELGTQQVDISSLADKSYFEIAQDVLGMLLNDYTAEEISACVDEAYRGTFASEEVTPLVKLDAAPGADAPQTYVMELFGGPTSAFKDVALHQRPNLCPQLQIFRFQRPNPLVSTLIKCILSYPEIVHRLRPVFDCLLFPYFFHICICHNQIGRASCRERV